MIELLRRQRGVCPRCQRHLEDCLYDGHQVKICPKCAGLWVKPKAWDQDTLGVLPVFHKSATAAARPEQRAPDMQTAGHSPLRCPDCLDRMTALTVGGPHVEDGSAFEIDQCDRCGGIWFDNGEWEQVAALRAVEAEEKDLERPTTWGEWCFQFFLGLPVEFNVAPRRFPVVTVGIIVLCALSYLIELPLSPDAVEAWGFAPSHLLSGFGVVTLFTCMFLHGSWAHLLGNMYFLYILGDNVEDALGRWRFLLFYLGCGVVGSLVFALPHIDSAEPLIGASGAVAGVMAAYLLLYPHARLTFMLVVWQWKVPAPLWLGFWLLFQLLASALDLTRLDQAPEVAYLAHVGGFFAGLAIIGVQRANLIKQNPLLNLLHHRRPATAAQGG